jgi:AGZA family xanthine/uracil permease-like MFS transporter
VIEREFNKASAFAFAGAIMTYFGFMHGESVGIGGGLGVTPGVALAYAAVAVGFLAVEKFGASTEAMSSEAMSSHPEIPLAAPAE